ncbi:MAG: branched-chain amino acid ABC transporter permease [Betaproteobacteria bacterium]|nr:branched-chain amino acid ABC transporter permease [Betaproteobacteria bacterium]MBL8532433.1 branched-chain amino acid ABC transporter permease [Betaproteobacteria bacterium]
MKFDRTVLALFVLAAVLLVGGPMFPKWLVSLLNVAMCYGIVVLGMLLLMRTGLVSFGHGLYYCLGAYAAGVLDQLAKISDMLVMMLAGALVTGLVAALLGLLLAKYRDIFFAMLSLAFSMILYGTLVKSASFGSTDGFNVSAKSIAGMAIESESLRITVFSLSVVVMLVCAVLLHWYLSSHRGRLAGAIKDNELRVEYMGASVRSTVHLNYVFSAVLAGVGGALMAINIGHIDPEMTYWPQSGEFVFIAILSGTGSVFAPLGGALVFESVRSFAYEYSPNTWQMVLGITMLIVMIFLPDGLWSLFVRRKAAA